MNPNSIHRASTIKDIDLENPSTAVDILKYLLNHILKLDYYL